jgi:hypothetical protein
MLLIVSARLQVTTLRVITCPTGCSSGAALGQLAYDVPLGDDARDPLVGVDNDQCTNATFRQQLDGGRKISARSDGGDVSSFAIKYRLDGHGSLSGRGRGAPGPSF